MTAIVRVWKVGSKGPWGRADGRFIDASNGRLSLQLWVFGDYRGDLLASLCEEACKDNHRPIRVTWTENKYGKQLREVEAVEQRVSA